MYCQACKTFIYTIICLVVSKKCNYKTTTFATNFISVKWYVEALCKVHILALFGSCPLVINACQSYAHFIH